MIVRRLAGNRGEVVAVPLSERAGALSGSLKQASLARTMDGPATLRVGSGLVRITDRLIFKFRGVDSITDAETLAGADVCDSARASAPPLPEGEYFQADLVGCEVVERATGAPVGRGARLAGCRRPGGCWSRRRWTAMETADPVRRLDLCGDRCRRPADPWWTCRKA